MKRPSARLRNHILACICMAWPFAVSAQAPAVQGMPGNPAMRGIQEEAFQKWLKEDNKLIDGILLSLKQIDSLVIEIEQMIRLLPDAGMPAAPVAVAPPAAVRPPPMIADEAEEEPARSWIPQLAGAALLALLAFWFGRKRGMAQAPQALPAHIEPVPAARPKSLSPTVEKRSVEPVAPAPPVATASVVPASPPPIAEPVPAPVVAAPPPPAASSFVPPETIDLPVAEENDQALELAEIMLSMGLGQGAANALAEQIRNEPKRALRHWLKLLEIYRKNGQQDEFQKAAEELRQHFNVQPEDWQTAPGGQRSLEDFPHIAKRLTDLWGTQDCMTYMKNLLDDNRGGARAGFPQSVAEELLLLSAMLRAAGFAG